MITPNEIKKIIIEIYIISDTRQQENTTSWNP